MYEEINGLLCFIIPLTLYLLAVGSYLSAVLGACALSYIFEEPFKKFYQPVEDFLVKVLYREDEDGYFKKRPILANIIDEGDKHPRHRLEVGSLLWVGLGLDLLVLLVILGLFKMFGSTVTLPFGLFGLLFTLRMIVRFSRNALANHVKELHDGKL